MMNKKVVLGIGVMLISGAMFAGCGTQPQATNTTPAVLSVDHQMIVENQDRKSVV